MAERERTTQILSGFKEHRSTLWSDFVDLVEQGVVNYADFVNGKVDDAKRALSKKGAKVEEKDFAELISDTRRAVEAGTQQPADPNARTEFSNPMDVEMASGGYQGQRVRPGDSRNGESQEAGLISAGQRYAVTDTDPAFAQSPERMGPDGNEVLFSLEKNGMKESFQLEKLQNALFSAEGGKYKPTPGTRGNGKYTFDTASALRKFFADRGIETDGHTLSRDQVKMVLEAAK